MKIYINGLKITDIAFAEVFAPYLVKRDEYTLLYTDSGIYKILPTSILKLDPVDKSVVTYANYGEHKYTLLVDPSYYVETNALCVIGDGSTAVHCYVKQCIYKLNPKSNTMQLVIDTILVDGIESYEMYFLSQDPINVLDKMIYTEINEYLSHV